MSTLTVCSWYCVVWRSVSSPPPAGPTALNAQGKEVYLRDIWPTREEIQAVEREFVIPSMFKEVYEKIEVGSRASVRAGSNVEVCHQLMVVDQSDRVDVILMQC